MPHESKRVLITGAGSGIGRALALEAAKRGLAVALFGRKRSA
jgi:short-subunit dehydrogenase